MATPGIGDPYWFEWYVGLKNIINMLNPDNGIEYVIFQCSKYNTIDDVVVGYKDGGHEILRPQKLIPIPFHRIGVTKLILVLATMGY